MKVNHEDRFLRRLFPPTRRIYGTTLTKLTVGQLLLLRRIWNPFGRALPLEETPFTHGHVAMALFILSRSWREAERDVVNGGLLFRLKLLRLTPVTEPQAIVAAFAINEHILSALDKPELVVEKRSPRSSATTVKKLEAPYWLFRLHQMIRSGMTIEQALDVPVALAVDVDAVRQEEESIAHWARPHETELQDLIRNHSDELQKLAEELTKSDAAPARQ